MDAFFDALVSHSFGVLHNRREASLLLSLLLLLGIGGFFMKVRKPTPKLQPVDINAASLPMKLLQGPKSGAAVAASPATKPAVAIAKASAAATPAPTTLAASQPAPAAKAPAGKKSKNVQAENGVAAAPAEETIARKDDIASPGISTLVLKGVIRDSSGTVAFFRNKDAYFFAKKGKLYDPFNRPLPSYAVAVSGKRIVLIHATQGRAEFSFE